MWYNLGMKPTVFVSALCGVFTAINTFEYVLKGSVKDGA